MTDEEKKLEAKLATMTKKYRELDMKLNQLRVKINQVYVKLNAYGRQATRG